VNKASVSYRAGACALALSFATLCVAQATKTSAPSTTRFSVTVTQVKPDMLQEWLDIQKNEVNPALKKAGVTQRNVSSTRFGNTYEYLASTPLENYAQLDSPSPFVRALGAEGSAKLAAKIRRCFSSSRTFVSTRQNDLSALADPKSPPPITSTVRRRITPGKNQEYRAYIQNDLLPIYKKAKAEGKIAGFSVNTRGMGSVPGEMTLTTSYNKFADMEGGNLMTRMLGQEAAQKLQAKAAGLSTIVESYVRVRNNDLSF